VRSAAHALSTHAWILPVVEADLSFVGEPEGVADMRTPSRSVISPEALALMAGAHSRVIWRQSRRLVEASPLGWDSSSC
jgi:hypothetical protein